MELASDNKLPFVGKEVLNKGCKLETSVYCKPTNTGLLLHHQSHVTLTLHQPTFTSTYWRTPLFSNRQTLKERPQRNHLRPYQQLFRFEEVQRKTGLSELWNVIHEEEKAMLRHTIRHYTRKSIYFTLSPFTCTLLHFCVLSPRMVHINLSNFILSLLENDDMASLKRCVKRTSFDYLYP